MSPSMDMAVEFNPQRGIPTFTILAFSTPTAVVCPAMWGGGQSEMSDEIELFSGEWEKCRYHRLFYLPVSRKPIYHGTQHRRMLSHPVGLGIYCYSPIDSRGCGVGLNLSLIGAIGKTRGLIQEQEVYAQIGLQDSYTGHSFSLFD